MIYELHIAYAGGEVELIETTDDHPFYVLGSGFVDVINLKPGNQLITENGETIAVISVVNSSRTDTVYNIEVADFHTYYATDYGILVHNCDWPRKNNKLSEKNPPINSNRQELHTNGVEGKSQFKDGVDASNLVLDAWRNGTPKFNKNGKLIGKVKQYRDEVGTQGQTSVDTRFSRKHGVHGFPSNKKE